MKTRKQILDEMVAKFKTQKVSGVSEGREEVSDL